MSELRHPLVGAHQPNFFPWLGFFHKLRWSDTFVLLDDVPIQRKQAGTVTNRVSFASNGKPLYITAPIRRSGEEGIPISAVEIAPEPDFRTKFVIFLKHTYGKSAFFKELSEPVTELVRNPATHLAAYNENAIRALAKLLAIETPIVLSSTLSITTMSTERLADIVAAVGGQTYFSGAGAGGYQELQVYLDRGLDVILQGFTATSYPRGKEPPSPGLSMLDALFHLGVAGTRELIDQPLDLTKLHRAPAGTPRP